MTLQGYIDQAIAPHADQWDSDERIPRQVLSDLAGLGVLGAVLGPWSGLASSGTDADVVLVEEVVPAGHAVGVGFPSAPSMADQRRAKSGIVLPVVAMSSTSTPGTRRPISAPAVAMRWS